jgi:putative DNA methylase
MSIHAFLKSRREQAGLSLRAAASRCSVDPGHLSRVESGAVPTSYALIETNRGQEKPAQTCLLGLRS